MACREEAKKRSKMNKITFPDGATVNISAVGDRFVLIYEYKELAQKYVLRQTSARARKYDSKIEVKGRGIYLNKEGK